MKIGEHRLVVPVMLAPLASITTPAFRILCEEQGCGLTWTEMVSVPGLVRKNAKIRALVRGSSPGRPVAVQLVGARPAELEQAAAWVVEQGADLIDLNMGCPVKKVLKTGGGVALMGQPELAEALVRAARRGAGDAVPVTVKMRSGYQGVPNAPELSRRLVDAGAAAITVHGRTREQVFRGEVDLDVIRQVVRAVHVPVVGNGDVVDASSYRRMREETGCAAVMVGRAALGNPWIFAQLAAAAEDRELPTPPTPADRLAAMRRHLELYLDDYPERVAVREIRKHLIWYSRGLPHAVEFRRCLQGLETTQGVHHAIDALTLGGLDVADALPCP
ncbi:MAG: tRNA dihydrouridine synthase DusB [bacterium]